MSARARRRALAAAAALLILAAAGLVLALRGGGGGPAAPADEAARLVPAGALAYVHLSTDRARPGVARAEAVARRLPGWRVLRARLLGGEAAACGLAPEAARGREAALAVLPARGTPAGLALVLLDTGVEHPRPSPRACGATNARYVGRFLALGPPAALDAAARLAAGRGRSLADSAPYRTARAGLPAERLLDGYLSAAGLRAVAAPRGGLLGAAAALLGSPGLRGVGFAAAAAGRRAGLTVHSVLDPRVPRARAEPFAPALAGLAPADAIAFAEVRGLRPALTRALAAAGGAPAAVGELLARGRAELGGGDLEQRLTALVAGQTSLAVTPSAPAPGLTLVARVRDEAAARRTLADLQAPVAALLAPPVEGAGVAPTFDQVTVGGIEAVQLRFGAGLELDYAVFDGLAVISTSLSGIAAVRLAGRRLAALPAYRRMLGRHPAQVTSLVFLDFRRLLALGEQTGLTDSRAYQRVRRDLSRVRTVGATTSGDPDETTLQIELEIP